MLMEKSEMILQNEKRRRRRTTRKAPLKGEGASKLGGGLKQG